MAEPQRAVPALNDLTQPFWQAASEQRLAIQRCRACGYYNHPPRRQCDQCLASDLGYEDVSGYGTVWSYTVMHQKSVAGFEESVPYLTALVELDEQPMLLLLTNLPGVASEDVSIGQRVRVSFERLNDEVVLPQFVPEASA